MAEKQPITYEDFARLNTENKTDFYSFYLAICKLVKE